MARPHLVPITSAHDCADVTLRGKMVPIKAADWRHVLAQLSVPASGGQSLPAPASRSRLLALLRVKVLIPSRGSEADRSGWEHTELFCHLGQAARRAASARSPLISLSGAGDGAGAFPESVRERRAQRFIHHRSQLHRLFILLGEAHFRGQAH